MRAAEILFPKNLRVTPSNIKKVMLIGSCMSAAYKERSAPFADGVEFEHVIYNNVADLPEKSDETIASFDFQLLQMPLRHIISDAIINFSDFSSDEGNKRIKTHALNALDIMLEAGLKYNRTHGLLTFISNFFVPQAPVARSIDKIGTRYDFARLVQDLNAHLADSIAGMRNVFLADVDAVSRSLGARHFLDDWMAFYSHNAYWVPASRDFDVHPFYNAPARIVPPPAIESMYGGDGTEVFEAVWAQLDSLYRVVHQIDMVKLVIFDLDDTLWRGQIGEHYGDEGPYPIVDGWPLGIWEAIQHLRARGIMTAICSKNDQDLVARRWNRIVYPGWLKLDDFLFSEINWLPKAENIAHIIKKAGLTPGSVVFVDDNPVEREAVRAALPGIRVIGENPYATRRDLLWSSETQLAQITSEAERREEMMRHQQERESAREAMPRAEFLASLGCVLEVGEISSTGDERFGRVFELVNKTNQFNTTGERRDQAFFDHLFTTGGRCVVFGVRDRFTDYGTVGVIILRERTIEQMVMSCRVLGLDVEKAALAWAINGHQGQEVRGRLVDTPSNMPCRGIFASMGFQPSEGGFRVFVGASLPLPPHIQLRVTG